MDDRFAFERWYGAVTFEKFVKLGSGVGRVWRSPLVPTTLERREMVRDDA